MTLCGSAGNGTSDLRVSNQITFENDDEKKEKKDLTLMTPNTPIMLFD